MGVIAIRQAIFGDRPRTTDALGHVLSGHFDMDTPGITAFGFVHLEELLHLAKDLREVAGLVAAARLDGVACLLYTSPSPRD